MKEYWKIDGMSSEGENYMQYFEFLNQGINRQINFNFFREGYSYLDIKNREDWAELIDRPLDELRSHMEIMAAEEFERIWNNR